MVKKGKRKTEREVGRNGRERRIGRRLQVLIPVLFFIAGSFLWLKAPDVGADAGNFRSSSSHSHSSSRSRSHSGSGDSEMTPVKWILVGTIIVVALAGGIRKRAQQRRLKELQRDRLKFGLAQIGEDENALRQMIARRYVDIQAAWSTKRWEPMRPLLSPQLYRQFEAQLNDLIRDGMTNIVEVLEEPAVELKEVRVENGIEVIEAEVTARLRDYTVMDATGEPVVGRGGEKVTMCYTWELIRTAGGSKMATLPEICPNCGAPVTVEAGGECPYCGSVIEAKHYDWVLNRIELIAQY